MRTNMVGLTREQTRQIQEWTQNLWVLLDQDDFNNIAAIFKNAVDREEYFQEYGESESNK